MIRFLLRFLGLLSLALAFIFLVYDGTKSIADQRLYVTKVAEVWATFHESSLTQVQADPGGAGALAVGPGREQASSMRRPAWCW